jgi:hypothetical protein
MRQRINKWRSFDSRCGFPSKTAQTRDRSRDCDGFFDNHVYPNWDNDASDSPSEKKQAIRRNEFSMQRKSLFSLVILAALAAATLIDENEWESAIAKHSGKDCLWLVL